MPNSSLKAQPKMAFGRSIETADISEKGVASMPTWLEKSFKAKYPEREAKSWKNQDDNLYIVQFTIDAYPCKAYYKGGKWVKTTMDIPFQEVPQKIKSGLLQYNVKESMIKNIQMIVGNKSPESTYKVEFLNKQKTTWFYELNKEGQVISSSARR